MAPSANTYLRNEQLLTVKPHYPGNLVINGQFANGEVLYTPQFSDVLKWRFSPNPQKAEKQHDTFQVPVKADASIFSSKEDMIVWLGHATFLIRLAGQTFLTDPVFYDLPLIKRKVPFPIPPAQLTNIDFLLLSHGHRDHLDEKSVNTLVKYNPQVKATGPLGMGKLLKKMAPNMPFQ